MDLPGVAFGQASGDDQSPAAAGILELCRFQDGVDRLPLRVLNEAASVDDDHICLVAVGGQRVSGFLQNPHHHLAVDEVLGAPEGLNVDLCRHEGGTIDARRHWRN